MKKKIAINNKEYELLEDHRDGYNKEDLEAKLTEYFDDYDYILGDYAYGKLRLKGFCDKDNEKFNKINDIESKKEYIEKQCAYNCRYFLIKKIK